ncbi:hypothetical protein ABPG72_009952 [Tetrahymena utriculariae]
MNPFYNNQFSQYPQQGNQNPYGQFPLQQGFQQYPPQQGQQQYPPQNFQQFPPQNAYSQYPPQFQAQQGQYPPQNYPGFNPQQNQQYPPPPQFSNQSSNQSKTPTKCNNDHPNYTKDRLIQSKRLEQDLWLVSQNQKFQAGVQEDGNLVVISIVNNQPVCVFSSLTKKKGDAPYNLQVCSNGNLELKDKRNATLWQSDTANQGSNPYTLIMQNDGNLVLFDSKKNTTWCTNTTSNIPVTGQPQCNNNHANYTKDRMQQGKRLELDKWLVSQNQRFYAGVLDDGNLVVSTSQNYSPQSCIWTSKTKKKGDGGYYLSVKGNGNLELQDKRNATIWQSDTSNQGQGSYTLIMQNDGNLALFDINKSIIWCTNTASNYEIPSQPKCNNNHANYTKDRLQQGGRLEQEKWLVSQNQKYYAGVQADGNLVISTNQNCSPYSCIWSSMTKKKGDGSNYLSIKGNGNVEIQDKRNAVIWETDTMNQGQGSYLLIMQNDGNLALFDINQRIIWCSNTARE